jgi:hypothetical protein
VIYDGLALMISAGLPLLGMLAELRSRALARYHAAVLDAPLTLPRTWLERRHLRRACATCTLVAELATSHAYRP